MQTQTLPRTFLFSTCLLLLTAGCVEKTSERNNDTFGTMAGVGFTCLSERQPVEEACNENETVDLSSTTQVLQHSKKLIKLRLYQRAETLLKTALTHSESPKELKFQLVEVSIRQGKWQLALSLIDELAVPVNDPLRLTVEARVGVFSAGTDFNLLPQIYRNELQNKEALRATVATDHLTTFELTRVDQAPAGVPSMEPSIEISADGQLVLVAWMEHINFPQYLNWHQKGRSVLSTDGGEHWTQLAAGSDELDLDQVDLDLITAHDPDNGYMYISGITWGGNGQEDAIYIYRINLNDGTQAGPFLITGDDYGHPADYDKALMVIDDDGGIYLTSYVPGMVKYSNDFGENFVDLEGLPEGMAQPRFSNGCLYLISQVRPEFWRCGLPSDGAVTTPASDNWWGYGNQVSGSFSVHNLSYMALHPNGDVFIIFSELKHPGSDELVIWMSKSSDHGDTWDDAWIVTPDIPGDKFLPWIEIDEAGVIHITYVDTRNNPQPDQSSVTYLDNYYAHSEDGGQTWLESRVTPTSLELIDGVSYGSTYSDYNEMAVGNNDQVFLSFSWNPFGNDMDMYVAKKIKLDDLIFSNDFD